MFPIYRQGVCEPPVEGENPERAKDRQRWASDTKKLPVDAITLLKRPQPADHGGHEPIPILELVNRLSNDQGCWGVQSEAAVADQADAAVESFEAAVARPEPDRVEDPVAVAADGAGELDVMKGRVVATR